MMNSRNDSRRIETRKIAAGKKRVTVVPSKSNRNVASVKGLVVGGILRALAAVPLAGFVLGFIVGGEVESGSRVGAGIASAIFITLGTFTGSRPWRAFDSSDVELLEQALPQMYIITPIMFLVLLLCWRPVYLLVLLFWRKNAVRREHLRRGGADSNAALVQKEKEG